MISVSAPNFSSFEPLEAELWTKEVRHSVAKQHGCHNINVQKFSKWSNIHSIMLMLGHSIRPQINSCTNYNHRVSPPPPPFI